MPKEEWGVKRACPKCSVRFYDLKNDPMTCPSCGATFDLASLTQQKSRATVAPKATPAPTPEVVDDADDVAVVLDDDDEDENPAAPAEDLGDDLLEADDEDTVNLEEIADVPAETDEN
jgi:uncharacterized protein (TIGR02300 family)